MGCDIHQINVVYKSDGTLLKIDGTNLKTFEYESDFVPELLPYRSYAMFAIIAGVRGDEFVQNFNYGVPAIVAKTLDFGNGRQEPIDCHSSSWYYMSDLLKQLQKTKHKIELFIKAKSNIDPEFISLGGIDEYEARIENVDEIIKTLENIQEYFKTNDLDFDKSIFYFFFDS